VATRPFRVALTKVAPWWAIWPCRSGSGRYAIELEVLTREKGRQMSILLHRDPRTMVPDLIDWFEEPFMTLRPYLAQPIKVEDFITDDHYTVRAELAGIDPEKDVEVTVGSGYLTIHAERYDQTEGKHRSEFRYGSFTRSLPLPRHVNEDDVKASYTNGILTVAVGLHPEKKEAVKKIEVKAAG
jgi:HSP20 family protein